MILNNLLRRLPFTINYSNVAARLDVQLNRPNLLCRYGLPSRNSLKSFGTSTARNAKLTEAQQVETLKKSVLSDVRIHPLVAERDVLLYQYEGCRRFKILFSIAFLSSMVFIVFVAPKVGKVSEEFHPHGTVIVDHTPWLETFWRQICEFEISGMNWYGIGSILLGYVCLVGVGFYITRNVRYIILRKGGEKVRVTTFSFVGNEHRYHHYDVPLNHLSCKQGRLEEGPDMKLKIKGRRVHFLINKKEGSFLHPELFDQTVGVYRKL